MRPMTYILIALAMILVMIAAIPTWRQAARDFISPDERKVIAKLDGSVTPKGPHLIVLKVKTRDQHFLEIYKKNESLQLMQRIALEEPVDARVEFQGRYTNLAMADIDIDGRYEIIAPMYDKNSTPRLLVYQYNDALETFEKITGD